MTKPQSDYGPLERGNHGDQIVLTETARAGVKRAYVVTQTPLDRYLARGQLGTRDEGKRRHEAGNRLYGAFYKAGLSNATTGGYEPRVQTGSMDSYRVLCIDSYREYMGAIGAVRDGARLVVYGVVLLHEPAGGPARMEMLRLGLDDVAKHFGIR